MKKEKRLLPANYALFAAGWFSCITGVVLPYIAETLDLDYTKSGTILSVIAVGNFSANFILPVVAKKIGRRKAEMLCLSVFCLSMVTLGLLRNYIGVCITFLIAGMSRGCNSIFCNSYVKENSDEPARDISMMHAICAIGCFLSPLVSQFLINRGLPWEFAVFFLATIMFVGVLIVQFMVIEQPQQIQAVKSGKFAFPKARNYYRMALLLFFYLGSENCLAGWFFTYLKSESIVSKEYASILIALLWFMVMCGRFFSTWILRRIKPRTILFTYCVIDALLFLMLPTAKSAVFLTIVIAGIGLFMGGVYPIALAIGLENVQSTDGIMALILGVAAVGGILTPQIVGIVADLFNSIKAGMVVTCVNACALALFSGLEIVDIKKKKQQSN